MRRVGIDIALRAAHKAAVYEDGERLGRPFSVAQTKEGVDELVRRATDGTSEPVEFVMEPTGLAWLPLAAELSRRGHRVYLPKPAKTHALRKFLAQHTKTDAIDACTAALVRHVDQRATELRVPSAAQTTLRLMVKQRSRLVVDAAKEKSRIFTWVLLANPHVGRSLGQDPTSKLANAFLRERLDPLDVLARGKPALRRFVEKHARRGAVKDQQLETLWQACEQACALFDALRLSGKLPFDYVELQLLVDQALEHIAFLDTQIAKLDARIAATYGQLDPTRLLQREVPGFGATIASAVEAFAGDVERFGSVKRYAAFFGLVPRTKQTGMAGEKPRQALTKGGQNLLKKYLFLAAEVARRQDPELAATYERALARGKHHYSAVIIVAHKLVRRVYALLKARAARVADVRYQMRRPDGTAISSDQARALIAELFPTKAAKEAHKRAPQTARQMGTLSQDTGSSEDAAKAVVAVVPTPSLPDLEHARKIVAIPQPANPSQQAKNLLDRS
ncbi:MAG TPA: IS110 family transposase [Kofleriaceae bacterium]